MEGSQDKAVSHESDPGRLGSRLWSRIWGNSDWSVVSPPYPWGIHSKSPRSSLKPNLIYGLFSYALLSVIRLNYNPSVLVFCFCFLSF